MSNAKLVAAKELIQEKHYAEARTLLRTVNHPTALKWLAKLDEIAPLDVPPPPSVPQFYPPPSAPQWMPSSPQAEQYYRRENRLAHRRRIGKAIELILGGIVCFVLSAIFAAPVPSIEQGGKMVVNIGLGWMFIPIGLLMILVGIVLVLKRD